MVNRGSGVDNLRSDKWDDGYSNYPPYPMSIEVTSAFVLTGLEGLHTLQTWDKQPVLFRS